jgi:hypothetical protein
VAPEVQQVISLGHAASLRQNTIQSKATKSSPTADKRRTNVGQTSDENKRFLKFFGNTGNTWNTDFFRLRDPCRAKVQA